MQRTILVFGLIAGFMAVCLQWIIYPLCYHGYMSLNNSYVGYAGLLAVFSMVFFGIKSYRDNFGGGSVTFWKAVQIGLLITLLASVIHTLGWHAYNAFNPDFKDFFIQKYTEYKLSGMPDPSDNPAVDAIKQEAEMLRNIYHNPLLEFVVTTIMMLPIGIIVTLISAGLLRKEELLPTAENKN